jgi:hypothetical protein
MQTFLPLLWPKGYSKSKLSKRLKACFRASCGALDNKRLGKQRVEALQLINAIVQRKQLGLHGPVGADGRRKHFTSKGIRVPGWINHLATLMWEDHLETLRLYMNVAIKAWCGRKNADGNPTKNTMKIVDIDKSKLSLPPFIGDKEFHATHRANLLYKDSDFYGKHGWSETPCVGYIWIYGVTRTDHRRTPEEVSAEEKAASERKKRRGTKNAKNQTAKKSKAVVLKT